ncbi:MULTISPECIES: helix-turn-helix domain-containing protein [Enterococcus]|uniref:Mga helix-turn-helix domain-containing protein n=1 Tax=Enterococcus dispar ATCC 51266 TaxID=1139219 RepID=S0KD77_9ENTE|nr:helix-turn-helix domain-containing protein [Enterococcus dispar]EOT42657.1 hypothetical protein OMK_01018 [Enterococcus dispar ATCC 51266]EOW84892.1 hypothetical protein I569_00181 [Enterococcus dispar ATCC 51266]MCU7356162.1 helix-turn-helix domain-containing protein [Enterococcus dispar]MDT2704745.1 helix-turn-helix domain-containing protein [Enterococcus dispar]OJG37971.1 hypothetical protein RV01_GL000680 [Enterococcus dispar]
MLEDILLDDPAQNKIMLFKHMLDLDRGLYPIHYFEKYTGFSHIKTANLLTQMNQDLIDLETGYVLFTEKEKIQIDGNLPKLHSYRQFLLQNSVPYRVLLATLLQPQMDLKEFGRLTELSQSSLMRRLKPLVAYLKDKGIRLNCLQMDVTGREALVRIMYFNFFWMVDFGTELFQYFEKQNMDLNTLLDENDLMYLKYFEQREFIFYQAISLLRTSMGYYVDEPEINHFLYPTALNARFKQKLSQSGVAETYREREANFVAYMIFYWPQYFSDNDPRLPYVRKNYKNLTVTKEKAKIFLTKMAPYFQDFSRSKQELLLINYQTIFLRQQLFQGKAPKNLDFILDSLKIQHPNYEILQGYIANVLDTEESDDLINLLTLVSLPQVERSEKTEKIKVGIIGFPNHFLLYSLIKRIEDLPFVEYSLMNTASNEKYDAIITCSASLVPANNYQYWIVEGEGSFDATDDFLFHIFKEKQKEQKIRLQIS